MTSNVRRTFHVRRTLLLAALLSPVGLAASCVRMTHQLEQSKPLEINVNVRLIDDRLDDFYAFEEKYRDGRGAGATATQPAPAPTQPSM